MFDSTSLLVKQAYIRVHASYMRIDESGQVVALLQASRHTDRVFLLLVVASDSLYLGVALCGVEFARAAIGFS